jgi:lipopolysaccharide biosynthesis glycosyltransferase
MCVFHQNCIRFLIFMIQSLLYYGKIKEIGIVIITSSSLKPLIEKVLPFKVSYFIVEDIDPSFVKLSIFNYDYINKFEKILYLDVELLVGSDLNPLFQLEISDKLYAVEEGHIGNEFYRPFFDIKTKIISAFSTGILLFKNDNSIKSLFKTILEHKENAKQWIVYHAISQNKYDNKALKAYVDTNPSKLNTKCLYHFSNGSHYSKISKITQFCYLLNKHEPIIVKNDSLSIIGMCVSYQYFDTLQFMLPANHLHFEILYVITQEDDIKTIDYCKSFDNVKVIFYTFQTDEKPFDKFGALNYLQKIVYKNHPDSWYLIIDSDIILPTNFVSMLNKEKIKEECIYGAIRYNVLNSSELLNKSCIINENYMNNNILWRPNTPPSILGCFQLYKKKDIYHRDCTDCSDGDYFFGYDNFNLFCNFKTFFVIHLGSFGLNWKGKKTYFNDDCFISLSDIYYTCSIPAKNNYYDKQLNMII